MQEAKTKRSLVRSSIFFVFSLLYLGATKLSVRAQSLPPARSDGFLYSGHRADSDAILIEAFFDPVCPDSRDSWPPLKQAVHSYGSRVSVVIHLLPLPYHDNSFAACRSLHIVNALNPNATFRLLDWFYKYQEKFYNAQTLNLSRTAVVTEMIKFASEAIGNSYSPAIEVGFSDRKTDIKTRVSFKYSASKGVFGTPTFYVNGFALPVPDASVPTDEKGWRSLINSLITQQGKQRLFKFGMEDVVWKQNWAVRSSNLEDLGGSSSESLMASCESFEECLIMCDSCRRLKLFNSALVAVKDELEIL